MAIVGLVMGSVLGFFSGIAGWLVWDMSAMSAFSLYLCISLSMAAMMIVLGALRQSAPQPRPAEAY